MSDRKCIIKEDYLTGIADAIRSKTGSTDTMLPSEMAEAIGSISASSKERHITLAGGHPSELAFYGIEQEPQWFLFSMIYTQSTTDTTETLLVGAGVYVKAGCDIRGASYGNDYKQKLYLNSPTETPGIIKTQYTTKLDFSYDAAEKMLRITPGGEYYAFSTATYICAYGI